MNRNFFDEINLTVARHASENAERLMARILAYCLNADEEFLVFTKGLDESDEAAIWAKSLDDRTLLWIDIGEPTFERLKKARPISEKLTVYSFNSKSDVWWSQSENKFTKLDIKYYQFNYQHIQQLAKMLERGMNFSITISEQSAFIATEKGECEVEWKTLYEPSR